MSFRPHPAVLGSYSWLFAQKIIPAVVSGSNPSHHSPPALMTICGGWLAEEPRLPGATLSCVLLCTSSAVVKQEGTLVTSEQIPALSRILFVSNTDCLLLQGTQDSICTPSLPPSLSFPKECLEKNKPKDPLYMCGASSGKGAERRRSCWLRPCASRPCSL